MSPPVPTGFETNPREGDSLIPPRLITQGTVTVAIPSVAVMLKVSDAPAFNALMAATFGDNVNAPVSESRTNVT